VPETELVPQNVNAQPTPITIMTKLSVHLAQINVTPVTNQEPVLNVPLKEVVSQIVNVSITIMNPWSEKNNSVPFVMSDVTTVKDHSIGVTIVPKTPKELVLQNVLAQKNS
jgi:hypothetical protein